MTNPINGRAPLDSGAHLFPKRPVPGSSAQTIMINVGQGKADIAGDTNVCLQAGVDYAAGLGGGIVNILPGRYTMHDSLHLSSRVTVRGAGKDTVLIKAPMVSSKLSAYYLGYGHFDIPLAEPDKFKVGMGIHIQDDRSGCFLTTCATLIYRKGNTFGINRSLNNDYCRDNNAVVRTVYPVISGYDVEDVSVENLAIDGNAEQNDHLNGCRGCGIFLLQAHRATMRNVCVRNFNGDGFSFQQGEDALLEKCRAEDNRGLGFHPGSGSTRPVMRRLVARNNGGDGFFYCLRVSFGLLEDAEFIGNGGHGISIGEGDTDQVISRCTIKANGGSGIYFRHWGGDEVGSHSTIADCLIEGNCLKNGAAEIHLNGACRGVRIAGNRILPGPATARDGYGVIIGKDVRELELGDNTIAGAPERQISDLRTG